jgi:hypothetical protein
MPRVPLAEREVADKPLPDARIGAQVSADAAGAAIGEGLTQAGAAANKIYQQEKRKADEVAVLEADRQLGEHNNDLLYNQDTGVLNKRGRDAFGAPEEAMQSFDDRASEIEQGLANDRQKLAFRKQATTRRTDIDRAIQRHVSVERQQFDTQETESYIANEINAGIAAAGDNERVDLSVDRTHGAYAMHADRNGLPDEWVNQKATEASSKIRVGVIDRLLAGGQDRSARVYYDQYKGDIAGAELPKIEKALEVGSVRGESQRQSDSILGETQDYQKALDKARKIDDPQVRDAVNTRIKDYFATQKQAEEERRATTFRNSASMIEKNGGDLRAIAPGDWVKLDIGQREALEKRSRQIHEGVEPVTNWTKFYDLMNLASADETRQQFMKMDLMQYRPELANAEFKQITERQSALRAGKSADEALQGYRTTKQIVDDALAGAHIDPTPKPGSGDAEHVNLFRSTVDQRILDLQLRTGKKATTNDVQTIVDDLLIKGKVPGSGFLWNSSKRVYELKPTEAITMTADKVPKIERDKIEAALRRNGRPVTDDSVVDLYQRRQQSLRGNR